MPETAPSPTRVRKLRWLSPWGMLEGLCVVVTAGATACGAYFGGIQADMARRIGEPLARAYIHAYVEEIPSEQNDNKNMYIYLSYRNHGQTPAKNMKVLFLSHSERLPPEKIEAKLEAHEGRYSLGRDQNFGYKIRLNMSADDYHALVRSAGQRYIYTSAKYDDVFDHPHYANFCFVLRPQSDSAPLTPCEFFNEAD